MTPSNHQITVCVYVDDLFVTCKSQVDIDLLFSQLGARFEPLVRHQGLVVPFLGMDFDSTVPGEMKVSMLGYLKDCLLEYGVTALAPTPAGHDLFRVNEVSPTLDKERKEAFHSRVAKLAYLSRRTRPDILTTIAFLSTRVSCSTEQDWTKLDRLLKYLNFTKMLGIIFRPDRTLTLHAEIDSSFAVHTDFRSHTGVLLSLGLNSSPIYVSSCKQRINTKSSAECELVAATDGGTHMIWTREFLIDQGYPRMKCVLHQDNEATIFLLKHGRDSSNRSRHVNIRYFWLKDRVNAGEVEVEYLETDKMRADMLTKPLQGGKFMYMRYDIMNTSLIEQDPRRAVSQGAKSGPK
jgi:hypothetical protein